MIITILGASGKTGAEVLAQALVLGHQVRVLVRKTSTVPVDSRITVIHGDVTNAHDVAEAIHGSDVVISALGAKGMGRTDLMIKTVSALQEACKETGVRRVILMSSFLAEQPRRFSFGLNLMAKPLMRHVVADKVASEQILRNSGIDWTIVYPTTLKEGPQKEVRLVEPNETVSISFGIPRASAAAWMLEEAHNNAYVKKSITITAV
jgi:putative NADH-flavin reductase